MGSCLGLFRYNGTRWDTLGLFGNKVLSAVVYHDTLIVGGAFGYMQDTTIRIIACHAGGSWHPYGSFGDQWNDGLVQRLRVIDGTLYAVGLFENADGQYCNGLAKRVGGHWEPMPGWTDIDFVGKPWVYDIIRYQGKLVVCGNFEEAQDLAINDMLQYDGSNWVPVCDGCLEGGSENPAVMAIYQDDLYVGGGFYYATGNAGQGIMRWDGQQWYPVGPVGEGIQSDNYSDQYTPDIGDLQVRNGLLWIGGGYGFVDHMAVPAGICSWDGTNFCTLQGDPFSDYYMPFAFYHDTLYGGTGPGVDDPAMRGVIRYLGELNYQCSNYTGVAENPLAPNGFRVAWSPAGSFTLLGLQDGQHQLRVYDAEGRLVLKRKFGSQAGRSEAVPLHNPSTALYMVVVDNERAGRLVPVH